MLDARCILCSENYIYHISGLERRDDNAKASGSGIYEMRRLELEQDMAADGDIP